jgi:hypothetical protein
MNQLYLDPAQPLRHGEVVELSNMSATIVEMTADNRPLTVDFRFATKLESPTWLWMRGEGLRLVAWTPPRIGETVEVPAGM